MRSTSSSESAARALDADRLLLSGSPWSLACTERMPFASMSKVTSIWGMPRGAGGMPSSTKLPELAVVVRHVALALEHADLHLRLVVGRRRERPGCAWSGWSCCGRSVASSRLPARLDAQAERGVTSSSSTSLTSPARTPPWTAAPTATTSSGFTRAIRLLAEERLHLLLDERARASTRRRGRPRRSPFALRARRRRARWRQGLQRASRSGRSISCSNFARDSFRFRCFGPDWSAVT